MSHSILSLDLPPASVHKTHGGKKAPTLLIKQDDEIIPIVTPRFNQSQGSKRVAAGPLVTTSDEEESSDSLPPTPRANVSQNREACEHDHDYENVASPSGSSTASGPVYERPPGFRYHAHEIKKTKKKKTAVSFVDFKPGLKKRAPTPPKVKPRRGKYIIQCTCCTIVQYVHVYVKCSNLIQIVVPLII